MQFRNRILVMDAVVDELEVDDQSPAMKRSDGGRFDYCWSHIGGSDRDPKGKSFRALVLGDTADTLDDGEAATIACAIEMGAVAVIDERKAKRICQILYPTLVVGSTVDVLALDRVVQRLGEERLAEAVYKALSGARMRVLPEHTD